MAKRRKVEEEEELFQEPEFDEKKFLIDEIRKARGIIVVFSLAFIVGIASGYIQVASSGLISALLGFAVLFSLKPILVRIGAEFKDRKTWFFAITMFLLIWFLGWTIALNPPLNDVSPPQIRTVEVYNGTAWVKIYDYSKGVLHKNFDKIKWGESMSVRAFVSDNVAVSEVKINGKIAQENGSYYEVSNLNPRGVIRVEAWDTSDIKESIEISVPTAS